jgi:hypothetical protein
MYFLGDKGDRYSECRARVVTALDGDVSESQE